MKKKYFIMFAFILCIFFCSNSEVFAEGFTCEALGTDIIIDAQLSKIVKYVIVAIQIAAPVLLVVLGTIDLLKGMVSQKEDDIKQGQRIFVKRLIAGILLFFVIALVKIMIGVFANGESSDIISCVNCIIGQETEKC